MNKTIKQGVLTLLRSALSGEKLPLPEEFSVEGAYSIIKQHRIMSICYCGACNCGIDENLPVMLKLQSQTYAELIHGECQEWELARICEELRKLNVFFMPVKGLFIKKLYSQPHMRYMADADILINENERGKIERLLCGLGYHKYAESPCEIIYENDNLHLELHKHLIPPSVKDYFSYFEGFAERAEALDFGEHKLRDEDHFIYIFVHFARHYRGGGIGLKHLCDIFVCKENLTLDEKYIEEELKKLGLLKFYQNLMQAVKEAFSGSELSETSDIIINAVFKSGAYGTVKSARIADAASRGGDKNLKKANRSRFIGALFLPFSIMKIKYPFLKKLPFLLPFMWVWRAIRAVFKGKNKVSHELNALKDLSADEVKAYADTLKAVGLNFDF